jgi:hypothetical protein
MKNFNADAGGYFKGCWFNHYFNGGFSTTPFTCFYAFTPTGVVMRLLDQLY